MWKLGVELVLVILQEFLIPGVLWRYHECRHFPLIISPLVERVEHLVAKVVQLPSPRAAALEVVGYVEAAVHPAVVLQSVRAYSTARQVALDWVSKELVQTSHRREN